MVTAHDRNFANHSDRWPDRPGFDEQLIYECATGSMEEKRLTWMI